jgi:hypothetical protein
LSAFGDLGNLKGGGVVARAELEAAGRDRFGRENASEAGMLEEQEDRVKYRFRLSVAQQTRAQVCIDEKRRD